jgi:hypothetical protein
MWNWNQREPRTSICLDAGGDLTRPNLIKKGNVLAKDGLEVELTNTLRCHLGGVDPGIHVNESADKHAHTYNSGADQILIQDDITRIKSHSLIYVRYDASFAAT